MKNLIKNQFIFEDNNVPSNNADGRNAGNILSKNGNKLKIKWSLHYFVPQIKVKNGANNE